VREFNNSLFIEDGNNKVNRYLFGSHYQDFTMRTKRPDAGLINAKKAGSFAARAK
jgi:hypothetical protein